MIFAKHQQLITVILYNYDYTDRQTTDEKKIKYFQYFFRKKHARIEIEVNLIERNYILCTLCCRNLNKNETLNLIGFFALLFRFGGSF